MNATHFTSDFERRFKERLTSDYSTGCLEWQGYVGRNGYGQVGFQRKLYGTHRVAWILANGEIEDGLFVCHRCDNRKCCNPQHLFLGSHADNMRDMFNKGRRPTRYGVQTANGRLTPEQIENIRRRHVRGRPAGHGVVTGNTAELAKEFGISRQYVSQISSGRWRTRG